MEEKSERQLRWEAIGKLVQCQRELGVNASRCLNSSWDSLLNFSSPSEAENGSELVGLDEELGGGFGLFLVLCGSAAALANALILLAVGRQLCAPASAQRPRNGLFLIITNFALIDEFKALCALYMGAVLLAADPGSILYFKMLQTSVLLMSTGNLASVLNLVLATANEFLYIRAPLRYSRLLTRARVGAGIGLCWAVAVLLSFARALQSSAADASTVLVNGQGKLVRTNETDKNSKSPGDLFSLVLLASLLLILCAVGAAYAVLYNVVRRSLLFHRSLASPAGLLPLTGMPKRLPPSPSPSTHRRPDTRDTREHPAPTSVSHFTAPPPRTRHAQSRRYSKSKDSRDFRQLKSLMVIGGVCLLNFVYLSIYFCIQLLHVVSVRQGLSKSELPRRYLANLCLRGLFVLHASLNPLLLIRIQSFRAVFLGLFRRRAQPRVPSLLYSQARPPTTAHFPASRTGSAEPAFI